MKINNIIFKMLYYYYKIKTIWFVFLGIRLYNAGGYCVVNCISLRMCDKALEAVGADYHYMGYHVAKIPNGIIIRR